MYFDINNSYQEIIAVLKRNKKAGIMDGRYTEIA